MSLSDKKPKGESAKKAPKDTEISNSKKSPDVSDEPKKRPETGSPETFPRPKRLLRLSPERKPESRPLIIDGEEVDTSIIKPIPINSRSNSPSSISAGSSPQGVKSNGSSDEEPKARKSRSRESSSKKTTPKAKAESEDDSNNETAIKQTIKVPPTRSLPQKKPQPLAKDEKQTESSSELPESEEEELLVKRTTPIKAPVPKPASRTVTPIKEEEILKPVPSSKKATPIKSEDQRPKTPPAKPASRTVTPLKEEVKPASRKTTPIREEVKPKPATPIKEEPRKATPIKEEVKPKTATPIREEPRKATPIREEVKPKEEKKAKAPPRPGTPPAKPASRRATPIAEEVKRVSIDESPPKFPSPAPQSINTQIKPRSALRQTVPLDRDSVTRQSSGSRYNSESPQENVLMPHQLNTESPRNTPAYNLRDFDGPIRYEQRSPNGVPSPAIDEPLPIDKREVLEIQDDDEGYTAPRLINQVIQEKRRVFSGVSPTNIEMEAPPVQYLAQDQKPAVKTNNNGAGVTGNSPTKNQDSEPNTGEFRVLDVEIKKDVESMPYAPMLPFSTVETANSKPEQAKDLKKQKKKLEKLFNKLITDNPKRKIDPFDPEESLEDETNRYNETVKEITTDKAVKNYQIGLMIGGVICDAFEGKTFELKSEFIRNNYKVINTYEEELRELASSGPVSFLEGFSPGFRLAAKFLFNFIFALLLKWLIVNFVPADLAKGLEEIAWEWRRGNITGDNTIGPNGEPNRIAELLSKINPIIDMANRWFGGGAQAPKEEVPVEPDMMFND